MDDNNKIKINMLSMADSVDIFVMKTSLKIR